MKKSSIFSVEVYLTGLGGVIAVRPNVIRHGV